MQFLANFSGVLQQQLDCGMEPKNRRRVGISWRRPSISQFTSGWKVFSCNTPSGHAIYFLFPPNPETTIDDEREILIDIDDTCLDLLSNSHCYVACFDGGSDVADEDANAAFQAVTRVQTP